MDHSQVKFQAALKLHQSGMMRKARELYIEILRDNPRHFDSRHLLGTLLIQTGSVRDGMAEIRTALTINPNSAEACYNLAHGFLALGDPKKALHCVGKAISLSPRDPEYRFEAGNILKDMKDRTI